MQQHRKNTLTHKTKNKHTPPEKYSTLKKELSTRNGLKALSFLIPHERFYFILSHKLTSKLT